MSENSVSWVSREAMLAGPPESARTWDAVVLGIVFIPPPRLHRAIPAAVQESVIEAGITALLPSLGGGLISRMGWSCCVFARPRSAVPDEQRLREWLERATVVPFAAPLWYAATALVPLGQSWARAIRQLEVIASGLADSEPSEHLLTVRLGSATEQPLR